MLIFSFKCSISNQNIQYSIITCEVQKNPNMVNWRIVKMIRLNWPGDSGCKIIPFWLYLVPPGGNCPLLLKHKQRLLWIMGYRLNFEYTCSYSRNNYCVYSLVQFQGDRTGRTRGSSWPHLVPLQEWRARSQNAGSRTSGSYLSPTTY